MTCRISLRIPLSLAIACAICLTGSAAAADRGQQQRIEMLQLLDGVPDIEDLRRLEPVFMYMDIDALEQVHGFRTPFGRGLEPAAIGQELGRWATIMSRFVVKPVDPLPYVLEDSVRRMATEYGDARSGLSSFFAIDRALVLGSVESSASNSVSPGVLLVSYGSDGDPTFEGALESHGYSPDENVDFPLWQRAGDPRAEMSDSYLGRILENAAEVSVVDRRLSISKVPGLIGELERLMGGQVSSLAQQPDVRAIVQAFTTQGRTAGSLIQAWFFDRVLTLGDATYGIYGPYITAQQRRLAAEQLREGLGEALPEHRWIAVAELQDGDDEIIALALTYEDLEMAERAAKIVSDRFPAYQSLRYKRSLFEVLDLNIDSRVQVAEDGDVAVAVIALRHPNPAGREIDLTRHGKFARDIFEALQWLSLSPVIVDKPNKSL